MKLENNRNCAVQTRVLHSLFGTQPYLGRSTARSVCNGARTTTGNQQGIERQNLEDSFACRTGNDQFESIDLKIQCERMHCVSYPCSQPANRPTNQTSERATKRNPIIQPSNRRKPPRSQSYYPVPQKPRKTFQESDMSTDPPVPPGLDWRRGDCLDCPRRFWNSACIRSSISCDIRF